MKHISEIINEILNGIRENPDRLLQGYREAYPGITDGEARELAAAFIAIFDLGTDHEKAQREYSKKLGRIAKKYPGGIDRPLFDFPELNFDI